MGKFSKGILGPFSGTIGTVVGGRWRGIDYMRSRPTTKNRIATPAQTVQTAKFTLVTAFVKTFKELFSKTYRDNRDKMSGTNSAVSYLLKNAVEGVYPDLRLNYAMVQVSRGTLPNAQMPTAEAAQDTVVFKWTNNAGLGSAKPTDIAILVVYHPASKTAYFDTESFSRRDEEASLNIPLKATAVETWLSFAAADGKGIAQSIYTGKVMLPA